MSDVKAMKVDRFVLAWIFWMGFAVFWLSFLRGYAQYVATARARWELGEAVDKSGCAAALKPLLANLSEAQSDGPGNWMQLTLMCLGGTISILAFYLWWRRREPRARVKLSIKPEVTWPKG
jgi:hypothetical protein